MSSKRNTRNQGKASGSLQIVTAGTSSPISKTQGVINPNLGKNKQKRKSKNKKNKVRAAQGARNLVPIGNFAMMPHKYLSACAAMYMKAICDPFDSRLQTSAPCIPDLLDQASFKFSTVQRGTFNIGTQGVGSIQISPFVCYNDEPNILITQAGYALADTPVAGDASTTLVNNTQFPWISTAKREVRTVACGLRVRYLGKTIDQAGVSCPFMAVGIGDNTSRLTAAQILDRDDTQWYNNDRTWRGCTYRPLQSTDYQYSDRSFPLSIPGTNNKMAVLVSGTAAGQMGYEVVTFFEALPKHDVTLNVVNAVPGVTKSDSDIDGLSTVRDFLGNVSNSEVGAALWGKGLNYLKSNAVSYAAGALEWI